MKTSKPEVVVITGASAGIGRATVREFAKRGAYIGLIARSSDGLNKARQEVEAAGGKALVLPTDVSDPAQVEIAAAMVEKEFGPIDIWVNNAMTSILSPFLEITPEEFRRVTEVTYLGYVHGTMAALRRMKPRERGTIVQVGSALAYRSIPLQSAYCGAKAAIRGFTDSIRCELHHDGSNVHITMVQMPAVNTPQFDWIKNNMTHKSQPVPPIFQPEVAAEAIVWAATHKRRELYVGSSTVEAILGNKVVPGILDHYLGKTGYKSQQTEQPENENRLSNLWEPLPGDRGAHGRFDDQAQNYSAQLWATENQDWLVLGLGAGVALVALGAYLGHQSQQDSQDHRITESDINQEVSRQLHQTVNRSSKLNNWNLLTGLARFAWKTLATESKNHQKATQS
ncbi:short-chain dehydrogenase [Nostoc piscinale CENA21]|uniref:Short-chain dehydrogenase n=1 Tax=Nostoc piscinale CENA21 TaxID=224013 RepID=A0A0M4SQK4_9NOSO|nr:SDR family oxidoreductase [Nostoc piscinale]ALF52928.1 short-chain dehydrogenase [Nostoc piscinale CENA21]